jgi:hypothetical protein
MFSITRERVRQIELGVIEKLRRSARVYKLQSFLPDTKLDPHRTSGHHSFSDQTEKTLRNDSAHPRPTV